MNSSKVFKQDPLFVPTSLVCRSIALPRDEAPPAVETAVPEKPAIQSVPEPEHPPKVEAVPEPAPEPVSEPEPASVIDLEAIRQEAYDCGRADLAAQFKTELNQAVMAFAEGCRKFDTQYKTMFARHRAEMINLIALLSEKIVRHELTTPRTVIAATLEAALDQAIESEEYYVTLHPDDLAVAEAKAPELIASIRGLSHLVFKTDASMTRGGCLLESSAGIVDASIELQLESMKEFLAEQPLFVSPPDKETETAFGPPIAETPSEA
ncbi:MAG: FliH/SctL family protein [Desulfobulbus sp.]|nr:FliH/SctL family protein [Desulfobulbus sp.]